MSILGTLVMVMNGKTIGMIGIVAGIIVVVGVLSPQLFMGNNIPQGEGKEGLHLKGHVNMVLTDVNGNVKQTIDKDNLIVTVGFQGIGKLGWNANSGTSPSATYRYLALGTGSTAAAAGDTALQTEVSAGGYSRQLTSAPTYSAGVITLSGAFTGFSCACVEVGTFDASSTGNMLSRTTYSVINIGSSDTLTITYTYTLS